MKILIKTVVMLMSLVLTAQSGINYKALIKDANGNVLSNQQITVEFTLLQTASLIQVYQETHTPTTDANGLINLIIGTGSTTDNFESVEWERGQIALNIQIDTGDGFIDFGITEFQYVPFAYAADRAIIAENVSGLEAINEGNGLGWRLVDKDPSLFGDIGNHAIDFSNSEFVEADTPMGAMGDYSMSIGRNVRSEGLSSLSIGNLSYSSGDHSFAFGRSILATGDYSFAFGEGTSARADYSFAAGESNTIFSSGNRSAAFGSNNIVSGSNSYAFGYNNNVSGSRSSAFGSSSEASGSTSFTFGDNLIAFSSNEVVIGQYNTIYTPQESFPNYWDGSDRLFVVANGVNIGGGFLDRSNALTILKNGNTGIGTDNPLERLHVADGRLRIGTETIEDTGSNQLTFNASLLPDGDNLMRLGNTSNRWVGVWAVDGTINTSDRREKKNINPIAYGLEEVLKMNPVSFNWKSENNPDLKLGLIAQELQELIPEIVVSHSWEKDEKTGVLTKKETDRLGVYYSDLVPVLIKAIQEQQEILENQNKKINELTAEINSIKASVKSKEIRY